MKPFVLVVLVLVLGAVSFSQEADIVTAKANVAECYLNATIQLLDAVPFCAEKFNVSVMDLSSFKDIMEGDKSALRSTTSLYDFDIAWYNAQTDMNATGDALRAANDSLVGTNLSMGFARLCYAGEVLKAYLNGTGCVLRESFGGFAKIAILAYYDATITNGGILLNNSKAGGLETTKMEAALDYGISLRPELVSALDTRDQARFKNVRLRFGRAEIRYFAEYSSALTDWAEPRVQYSGNYNKDGILSYLGVIRQDVVEIDTQCPAIYTVGPGIEGEARYEEDNFQCWQNLQTVQSEARAVIALYRSGVPVVVGGVGSLHAQGNGEVSAFGSAQINITGKGDLYVTDFKGDASTVVDVPGEVQPDGSTRYAGFSDARIKGSLISVLARGNITFDATGKGMVKMHGTGSFYTSPGLDAEGNYTEVK